MQVCAQGVFLDVSGTMDRGILYGLGLYIGLHFLFQNQSHLLEQEEITH